MTDDLDFHGHIGEAIRHLRLAQQRSTCSLCEQLTDEEIAHLEMTDQIVAEAEQFVEAQAEKRAELSEGVGRAEEIRSDLPAPAGGPYANAAEVSVHGQMEKQGWDRIGPYHYRRREGFIESLVRNRPRLTDLLPGSGR